MKSHAVDTCFGYCRDCERIHRLPAGNARAAGLDLMREFKETGRLDYLATEADADPRLSLDYLFPDNRGQMFGVLECENADGTRAVLRSFSSLHEGVRGVPGWVPSILSDDDYARIVLPGQQKIRRLTREMAALPTDSPAYRALHDTRRTFSRSLMKEIHGLYRLHNFRGASRPLSEVFQPPPGVAPKNGIPGGVGDCCAPKLLNFAARRGLKPRGLAEFYWGATETGGKVSGEFYPCCESRCRPILGFMLCGLDDGS